MDVQILRIACKAILGWAKTEVLDIRIGQYLQVESGPVFKFQLEHPINSLKVRLRIFLFKIQLVLRNLFCFRRKPLKTHYYYV